MTITVESWVHSVMQAGGAAGYQASAEAQGVVVTWYGEGEAPTLGTPVLVTILVGGYVKIDDAA